MLNEWSDRKPGPRRQPDPGYTTSWIWVIVSFVAFAGFLYVSLS
jgi:hypothetical protein